MSHITNLWLSGVFFSSSKYSKTRFRPPDPARGAYDAPPNPLVGWGGATFPFPSPLMLDLGAEARLSGPQHEFLATPMTQNPRTSYHQSTALSSVQGTLTKWVFKNYIKDILLQILTELPTTRPTTDTDITIQSEMHQ